MMATPPVDDPAEIEMTDIKPCLAGRTVIKGITCFRKRLHRCAKFQISLPDIWSAWTIGA